MPTKKLSDCRRLAWPLACEPGALDVEEGRLTRPAGGLVDRETRVAKPLGFGAGRAMSAEVRGELAETEDQSALVD
jgi:hypothetical protein